MNAAAITRDPLLESQCRARLCLCGLSHVPIPAVHWNDRLQRVNGTYDPRHHRIELNPRLHRHPGEVTRTLWHELAHAVADRWGKDKSHGWLWQHACAALGIPGEERCGGVDTRKVSVIYQCPHCGGQVTYARRTRPIGCGLCCKAFNSGRYHPRYRLRYVETREVL